MIDQKVVDKIICSIQRQYMLYVNKMVISLYNNNVPIGAGEMQKLNKYVQETVQAQENSDAFDDTELLKVIEELPVTTLIKISQDVLGETVYGCLYKFFLGVLYAEYDRKIIKIRRAYVLFQIFSRIIISDMKNQGLADADDYLINIYTDIYLYSLSAEELVRKFGSKTLLVVDDILIHGRALSELVEFLADNNIDKVAVCVFAEYENAEAISEVLEKSIQNAEKAVFLTDAKKQIQFHSTKCNVSVWQMLSNKLVELIQCTNYAYAAFTDSYRIANDVTTDKLKQLYKLSYSCAIPQSLLQQYTGMHQELLVDDMLFSSLSENENYSSYEFLIGTEYLIRKYTYAEGNQTIIPFTLLPLLQSNVLQEIYYTVNKQEIVNANIATSMHMWQSQYKWLFYCVSDNFIQTKFRATDNTVMQSTSCYKYAFNDAKKDIAVLNSDVTDENKISVINTLTEETKASIRESYAFLNVFEPWTETAKILKCVLDEIKITSVESICDALTIYMDRVHQYNEERAKRQLKREKGISIHNMLGLLYSAAKKNTIRLGSFEWAYIMGYLINMWDNGIANYNVDVYYINNTYWVDGCVTDGEQAYHAIFNTAEYADYVVCSHMITQTAGNMLTGVERLSKFEEKLNRLKLIPDSVDFSRLIKFYKKNGTFQALAQTLCRHRPPEYLMDIIYQI